MSALGSRALTRGFTEAYWTNRGAPPVSALRWWWCVWGGGAAGAPPSMQVGASHIPRLAHQHAVAGHGGPAPAGPDGAERRRGLVQLGQRADQHCGRGAGGHELPGAAECRRAAHLQRELPQRGAAPVQVSPQGLLWGNGARHAPAERCPQRSRRPASITLTVCTLQDLCGRPRLDALQRRLVLLRLCARCGRLFPPESATWARGRVDRR